MKMSGGYCTQLYNKIHPSRKLAIVLNLAIVYMFTWLFTFTLEPLGTDYSCFKSIL